jgi:hypothetical protein
VAAIAADLVGETPLHDDVRAANQATARRSTALADSPVSSSWFGVGDPAVIIDDGGHERAPYVGL